MGTLCPIQSGAAQRGNVREGYRTSQQRTGCSHSGLSERLITVYGSNMHHCSHAQVPFHRSRQTSHDLLLPHKSKLTSPMQPTSLPRTCGYEDTACFRITLATLCHPSSTLHKSCRIHHEIFLDLRITRQSRHIVSTAPLSSSTHVAPLYPQAQALEMDEVSLRNTLLGSLYIPYFTSIRIGKIHQLGQVPVPARLPRIFGSPPLSQLTSGELIYIQIQVPPANHKLQGTTRRLLRPMSLRHKVHPPTNIHQRTQTRLYRQHASKQDASKQLSGR